jgi:hypothetical protein
MVLVDADELNPHHLDQYTEDNNINYMMGKQSGFDNDLNKQIYEILQNTNLNDYDKCKLYAETLKKHLFFKEEETKKKEKRWNDLTQELSNSFSKHISNSVIKKYASKTNIPVKRSSAKTPSLKISSAKKSNLRIEKQKRKSIEPQIDATTQSTSSKTNSSGLGSMLPRPLINLWIKQETQDVSDSE